MSLRQIYQIIFTSNSPPHPPLKISKLRHWLYPLIFCPSSAHHHLVQNDEGVVDEDLEGVQDVVCLGLGLPNFPCYLVVSL